MKKYTILILVVLNSLFCFSQDDFREGFVVKQSGDTLRGLINYRGGSRDYTSCFFQPTGNSEIVSYTPDDISGFGFPGDRLFVSKIIDPVTVNTFNTFIEVLVKGAASLYYYNGRYFIQKNGSALYELAIVKSEIKKEGQKVTVVTKKYLEILTMLFSDCNEAREMISTITLNERPLTQLTEVYNICVNSPYEIILSGKPGVKVSVGLSAGIINSNLDIYSRIRSDQVSFVDVPYDKSNSVQGGLSFHFTFPRFSEKLSFLGEVVYFKSQYYSYTRKEYPLAIDNNYVTIGMEQLSIPVGVRYTFFSNKISPYLNLGFFNTINLNTTNLWTRETELLADNSSIFDEGPALKEIHGQYGFWAGTGVVLPITKRIAGFVDLRSEFSYGLSKLPDVSTVTNLRISFGLKIH